MFSGSWNSFDMSFDETFKNDIKQHFLDGRADELLDKLRGQLNLLSDHDRVYLWIWAIAKQHDKWIWALWSNPGHQQDVITTSLTVLMSSDLAEAMPGQNDRQIIAYDTLVCLLRTRGEHVLEEFDREALGWAVQRAMLALHIEDQQLLDMFARRSEFPSMRVGNASQSDIVEYLQTIIEPIVQTQESGDDIGQVLAPSMFHTMRVCCQGGIDLSGSNGLDLGHTLSRGCIASGKIFKPLLDDWITYGGAWQTLLRIYPDIEPALGTHPKVRAAKLMAAFGREEEDQDPPAM